MHHAARASTTTIARTIGTVAAALWLIPMLATLFGADDPGSGGSVAEGVGVGILATVNIAAVAIAWSDERLGGRLLLGAGALFAGFAIVTAGRNQWLAAAVSGGPFLLAGVLFIVAARRRSQGVTRERTSRGGATMAR